jgi:hypothetical protein
MQDTQHQDTQHKMSPSASHPSASRPASVDLLLSAQRGLAFCLTLHPGRFSAIGESEQRKG